MFSVERPVYPIASCFTSAYKNVLWGVILNDQLGLVVIEFPLKKLLEIFFSAEALLTAPASKVNKRVFQDLHPKGPEGCDTAECLVCFCRYMHAD